MPLFGRMEFVNRSSDGDDDDDNSRDELSWLKEADCALLLTAYVRVMSCRAVLRCAYLSWCMRPRGGAACLLCWSAGTGVRRVQVRWIDVA